MKRKIICFVFALLMLASVFPFSVFASEISSVNSDVNLSKTEIIDDFKYTFAGAFDINDYPSNSKDENIYFVSAMEGKSSSEKTELYIYLYNPSMKQIVKHSELDKISIAIFSSVNDESENTYTKRDISLIKTHGATNETGTLTNATLLKYKLELEADYDDTIDRYYRIADFEVHFKDDTTATAYLAGQEFKFFNDEFGYVNCSVQDLTTLEMDAFHTFYRVNTEGVDEYDDIQSIYFPVSNELLEAYGGLYSMDVVWESYWTNQCLVVDNEDVRDAFYKKWVNGQAEDFKYSVLYNQFFPINDMVYDYYYFGHNVEKLSDYIYWDTNTLMNPNEDIVGYKWSDSPSIKPIPDVIGPKEDFGVLPITMVFKVDDATTAEAVSVYGEEILAYLEKENWDSDIFWTKRSHNQTFTVELADKELNVYELCSGWEKFWHGDYYEKDTGEKITYSAFQSIDLNDLATLTKDEFSKKYLIDKNDVECEDGLCNACFACHANNKKYADCTWFLLRYDTTRYRSYDALVVDNETGNAQICNANLFETEVIRNFDTISVMLKKTDEFGKAVYTVFPIKRSPTNFASDAWNPSEKPVLDLGLKGDNDFWNKLELVLKIVFCVVIVLLLFKVWDLIKPVFKGAYSVVSKPFKKINRKDKK